MFGNLHYRYHVVDEQFGCATGGQNFYTLIVQSSGKFNNTVFVRNTDECASYRTLRIVGHKSAFRGIFAGSKL